MLLVDKDIITFCANGNISKVKPQNLKPKDQTSIFNSNTNCITNIGYDLRAFEFHTCDGTFDEFKLLPGASVFVSSNEIVHFDENTAGNIQIKNSRLRMGLSVESPMYQPGHTTTIYFRLTNLGGDTINLKSGDQYATLVFHQLHQPPQNPYNGAFQKEFNFKGLADYSSKYEEQINEIQSIEKDIKTTEKNIYGNVITILTIFIAIFSLINVNIELVAKASEPIMILFFNLSIVGAVSLFALFIHQLMYKKKDLYLLWLVPIICFISIVLIVIYILFVQS